MKDGVDVRLKEIIIAECVSLNVNLIEMDAVSFLPLRTYIDFPIAEERFINFNKAIKPKDDDETNDD